MRSAQDIGLNPYGNSLIVNGALSEEEPKAGRGFCAGHRHVPDLAIIHALIFAFEAAVIGGTGSLWGTLFGGVVLGVAQSIGAQLNPQGFLIAGHAVFLIVLVARTLFERFSDLLLALFTSKANA